MKSEPRHALCLCDLFEPELFSGCESDIVWPIKAHGQMGEERMHRRLLVIHCNMWDETTF